MKYSNVVREFINTPWAIMPDVLAQITDTIQMRFDGGRYTDEELVERIAGMQARYDAARGDYGNQAGAVAVVPIMGVLTQRADMFSELSGAASAEKIGKQLRALAADSSVGAIVLNIDSPGGSVYGIQELGAIIKEVSAQKKTVAVANSLAASAAYWLATSAGEFVITPGGEAGSIGVLTAHVDASKYEEMLGVKTTLISAGKYKVEGNPYEPLTQEARDFTQKRVNEYYDMFVKAVAKNRGVAPDAVRTGFGQGRVLGAKEAVAENMADNVETIDAVIARLSTKRGQNIKTKQANQNALRLAELS